MKEDVMEIFPLSSVWKKVGKMWASRADQRTLSYTHGRNMAFLREVLAVEAVRD